MTHSGYISATPISIEYNKVFECSLHVRKNEFFSVFVHSQHYREVQCNSMMRRMMCSIVIFPCNAGCQGRLIFTIFVINWLSNIQVAFFMSMLTVVQLQFLYLKLFTGK